MNTKRVEQLNKLIEEDFHDPFYVYALAMEFLGANPLEAKRLLITVHQNHPAYLPVYYQLAALHIDLDELQAAENILQQGIALARQQNELKALHELKNLLTNLND